MKDQQTLYDKKKELFEVQKKTLYTFLKTGAISKEQYDKSLERQKWELRIRKSPRKRGKGQKSGKNKIF